MLLGEMDKDLTAMVTIDLGSGDRADNRRGIETFCRRFARDKRMPKLNWAYVIEPYQDEGRNHLHALVKGSLPSQYELSAASSMRGSGPRCRT